jgi:hypothetical protein
LAANSAAAWDAAWDAEIEWQNHRLTERLLSLDPATGGKS